MWELDYKESWAPKNWCFWTAVLGKTLESPLDCKDIQPVHPKGNQSWNIHFKDWCWSWNSNTLATWCEEVTHFKRPWCWERLKVRGKGDNRGWDGWMASLTQWTWVWVNSRSWWWTGRPGMLQSMGLQSQTWLSHWTELNLPLRTQRKSWSLSQLPTNKKMGTHKGFCAQQPHRVLLSFKDVSFYSLSSTQASFNRAQ